MGPLDPEPKIWFDHFDCYQRFEPAVQRGLVDILLKNEDGARHYRAWSKDKAICKPAHRYLQLLIRISVRGLTVGPFTKLPVLSSIFSLCESEMVVNFLDTSRLKVR